MVKWEYLAIFIPGGATGNGRAEKRTSVLNSYGALGWELVCMDDEYAYFKRPKQ